MTTQDLEALQITVPTNIPDAFTAQLSPLALAKAAPDISSLIARELGGQLLVSDEPAGRTVRDLIASYAWRNEDRIIPVLQPRPGVTHVLSGPRPSADGTTDSINWAGTSRSGSWTAAYGVWRVPTVTKPTTPAGEDGTWKSSSWVGMNGAYGSVDVLQAGIRHTVGGDGSASYYAWYEWYAPETPKSPRYIWETPIVNFPVAPGDEIFVGVVYANQNVVDHEQGHVHVGNLSNGKYFTLYLPKPPGASSAGNSAEWIVEAPDTGEPLTSLPRFSPVHFSMAAAIGADGSFGDGGAGDTWNILRYGKRMTSVEPGYYSSTVSYVGDDVPPKIGFSPQDRFMVSLGATLVVVRNDGNVFGANLIGQKMSDIFQFSGAKIGFNPQDRFMMGMGRTLVVVTKTGDVFGANVVGTEIGPVFQFSGAKIGFNSWDRFMMVVNRTLVVVTDTGDVYGADAEKVMGVGLLGPIVVGTEIGPVFQFSGAKIGFNPQDRFMLASNHGLLVVRWDGDVFGSDIAGRNVNPVFQINL